MTLERKPTLRVVRYEANISTAHQKKKKHTRLPREDGDQKWQEGPQSSPSKGALQTHCQRRALGRKSDSIRPLRFTLSKSEILRGYKSFTRVITSGNSISAPPLRCHFTRAGSTRSRIMVGFSVSRNFKRAIDRNKAKRLMREAYRLSKHHLVRWSERRNESLEIIFMYTGSRVAYPVVESFDAVKGAMQRLIGTISTEESNTQ